jgi:transcriptional repressor NrdR
VKCPFCAGTEDRVVDSRELQEGAIIRRRRECKRCGRRFTTVERVEKAAVVVVKKDGRRENFDREKLRAGIMKACAKRPISAEQVEKMVEQIEEALAASARREIPSQKIGEEVMKRLYKLDKVAYIRFASVYRRFEDVLQFVEEIERGR